MSTVGVILARLQPIHNGHLALIRKSYMENERTFVFIGSADKFNARNPIPINVRLQLAQESVDEMVSDINRLMPNQYLTHEITILALDDLSDESNNTHEWGFYLYSKVVTATGSPNFTMYYSDGFEIITTWFPGFILSNNISLNLISRNAIENGISATKVREMIVNHNDVELEKYVPASVFAARDMLEKYINLSSFIK